MNQVWNSYNGLAIRRFSPLSHLSPEISHVISHVKARFRIGSLFDFSSFFILSFLTRTILMTPFLLSESNSRLSLSIRTQFRSEYSQLVSAILYRYVPKKQYAIDTFSSLMNNRLLSASDLSWYSISFVGVFRVFTSPSSLASDLRTRQS